MSQQEYNGNTYVKTGPKIIEQYKKQKNIVWTTLERGLESFVLQVVQTVPK